MPATLATASSTADHRLIADTDWSGGEGSLHSLAMTMRELFYDNAYKAEAEKDYIVNKHLLFGHHWYIQRAGSDEWEVDTSKPGWRARLTYNEILASIEHRVAKFVREGRIWAPAIDNQELSDRIFQRTASKVLMGYWKNVLDMPRKVRMACQTAMSSRICWGHLYWDRMVGPHIRIEFPETLYGLDTIPDLQRRAVFVEQMKMKFANSFGEESLQRGFYEGPAGELKFDVVPVPEMSWWPHEVNSVRDEAVVMMRTVRKPVVEMAERLGVEPEEIRNLSVQSYSDLGGGFDKWRKLHYTGETGYDVSRRSGDSVLVHTLVRKPCGKYPKGRQAVGIEGAKDAFWVGDSPLEGFDFPFFELQEKPVRGASLGTSTVEQLKSAQKDINVTASQAQDYRNQRVAPTIINFAANRKQGNKFTNRPGSVFEATDPSTRPVVMDSPDIPPDMFNMIEMDRFWMARIAGTPSIDRGETRDAHVRSGRAIGQLQQRADLPLVLFGQELDDWVSDTGNGALQLLQRMVHAPRVLHLMGEDDRYETLTFTGADLRPGNWGQEGSNRHLIEVHAYSQIPKEPADLINFVSMGLQADPTTGKSLLDAEKDRNGIIEMLGFGQFRKSFDRNRLDTIAVAKKIAMWEAGTLPPPPREEENHEVFIHEIERWKKTDDYEIARYRSMMVAENVDFHLRTHRMALARQLIRPQYDLKRADIAEWMSARADVMERLGPVNPEMAQVLINMMFPLPLTAMAQMAQQQEISGDMEGGGKEGGPRQKPKEGGSVPNREKKQGLSRKNQGTTTKEQGKPAPTPAPGKVSMVK